MSEVNVANHVLESILKDLSFLKDNNFLPHQTYRDVVAMLPNRISNQSNTVDTSKPPLPTRKSTSSTTNSVTPPIVQPREMPSFPKLPVRRTPDWQSPQPPPQQQQHHQAPQQLVGMIMPSVTKNILHSEPEKSTPPPPAYTQKPTIEPPSLATAEALYDYKGEDPSTDLSFRQGDIIEVTEYVNDDWWKGSVHGKSGIFPQNHVKKIPPPIKAKRPWVPPTAAKPSFSTSSNTSNTPPQQHATMNNTTMPYSYPPPPTAMYTPPPAQPPIQAYGQPAAVPVVANSSEQHGEAGESKVKTMGSKFGKQVGTAAMWGFGATIGSQAANAIF